MSRKVGIEPCGQQPVKKKIDKALFPGKNIQSAMFAAEIAMQRDPWAEGKGFALKRVVDRREIAKSATREVVEIAIVGGSEQGFAPREKRLGIEGNGGFVEFSFIVKIAPVDFGSGRGRIVERL
jgi:hypothetical protein